MAPTPLTLFPAIDVPRRPSGQTRKPKAPNAQYGVCLSGVTFRVVPPKIQPAEQIIHHSLFCEPPAMARFESPASVTAPTVSPGASSNQGAVRRHSRTCRSSSPVLDSTGARSTSSLQQEDSITELPGNIHFGLGLPPRRALSTHSERSMRPERLNTISMPAASDETVSPSEYKDAVSPLPERTHFDTAVPGPEYPTSPFNTTRNYTGPVSPLRSIFPRYDPSKPLSHQAYYPTALAQSPPAYYSPIRSSIESPSNPRQELKRYDSAVGLIDGYEHIPAAGHADLEALWKASNNDFCCEGRKVQFPLYQSAGSTALAIGTSPEDTIYSLEKDSQPNQSPKRYAVKKHCPTSPCSSLVAQLTLPNLHNNATSAETTAIFPQSAAYDAIERLSTSPRAPSTSTFDTTAPSPAAQILAQEMLSHAHEDYTCTLTCQTRSKDNSNNITATYTLSHPHLGHCPITVTKSSHTHNNSARTPGPAGQGKAKISLHHPTATPAALSAETLNLAFLDFGAEACVIDITGLIALDSMWVIDTIISALIAVALIENERVKVEEVTFDAPPTAPVRGEVKGKLTQMEKRTTVQRKQRKSEKQKLSGFLARRKEKRQVQEICNEVSGPFAPPRGEQVQRKEEELPGFGRAVVGLVGMSLKGGLWVAKTGVKVAVKGVKAVKESAAGPPR